MWAADADLLPITATMLGIKLKAMGIVKRKVRGKMVYLGISLKAATGLKVVRA
jgi:hypothetical protein